MKPKTTRKALRIILATFFVTLALSCAGKGRKAVPEGAPVTPQGKEMNVLRGVELTAGDTGAMVAINTSKPASPLGYFLDNPPRIIVDIPQAVKGSGIAESYPGKGDLVEEIIISSVGSPDRPTARVEVKLSREADYEINKENGKVMLSVGGGVPSIGAVAAGPGEEAAAPEVPAPEPAGTLEAAVEEEMPQPGPVMEAPETLAGEELAPESVEAPVTEEPSVPAEPVSPASKLLDITTVREENVVKVIIMTDGAVAGFDAFTLPAPPRIVIDLADLTNVYPARRLNVGQGDVKAVRIGQHPDKVRVVMDLETSVVPYSTRKEGKNLVVYVGEGARKVTSEPEKPSVVPLPESPSEQAPAAPEPMPAVPETEFGAPVVEPMDTATDEMGEAAPEMPGEAPEVPSDQEVPAMMEPEPMAPTTAAAPGEAPSTPDFEAVEITAVDFDYTEEKSVVRIETTGKAKYEVVTNDRDKLLSIRIKDATIPPSLERSLDTSEFAGPVKMVSSYQWSSGDTEEVYVTLSLNFTPQYFVVRDGNTILVRLDNPSSGQVAAKQARAEYAAGPGDEEAEVEEGEITEEGMGPGGAEYFGGVMGTARKNFTGRLVYLDYQKIDVVDALSLLAEVAGLNLVVSGELKGTVSLKLEAVPWDQALDIILRTNKYGGIIRGNILRVAPMGQLEEEIRKMKEKQKRRMVEAPLEMRIIFVSYADPEEVATKLENMLTPGRGRIEVDERTSSLLIWDVPEQLNEIEKLVRKLDVETPQVLIETRIVEARSSITEELGVNWGIAYHSGAAYGNPTGLNFPGTVDVGVGLVQGVQGASDAALTQGQNAIGITLGSLTNAVDLDLLLRALELEEKAKVVSSPRILTLDNQTAEISQGIAIPFSTTSAAGTKTEFVDANLKLEVTPHVTADGRVAMEISAQRNSPVTVPGAAGPGINKNEASTQILIKDGETAVIGGIFTMDKSESQTRVPFLGKIPFLGWLFRTQQKSDDRRELIIFLTPRIVSGGQQYKQFADTSATFGE